MIFRTHSNAVNDKVTGEEVYIMPPALQPQAETITLEQYEAFPETRRAEVFENVVYDMASPSQIHQRILLKISSILDTYMEHKKGDCVVIPSPFDVILSRNPLIIVQPDIMIVCDTSKLDGNRCNGAPDFVIEIVSPGNPSDDYIKKAYYYKNYGVREYWIVDPRRKTVTNNFFEKDILNIQYSFESVIKVNIYDDLFIDFSDISSQLGI